jgi:hypothetical protein
VRRDSFQSLAPPLNIRAGNRLMDVEHAAIDHDNHIAPGGETNSSSNDGYGARNHSSELSRTGALFAAAMTYATGLGP